MPAGGTVDALLVGHEDQENLGLRHIMAYLDAHGVSSCLRPFVPGDPEPVVRAAREGRPALIGFSIIFQYDLREFVGLMRALRLDGCAAHFTAGGHFPSLRPEATLRELPDLDSVVLFEGELTALELIQNLRRPQTWTRIKGLAFRDGEAVVVNEPRPLVPSLDDLPWPRRGEVLQTCRGIPMAPILASRGCLFDCSFCSIRQFYAHAPGPLRRSRSPEDVAAEMRFLFDRRGVRLFLFQDDDFAARSSSQRRWVDEFLDALKEQGLAGEIGWKISCRVDDVDPDIVARCREHGLMVVYLGVESGTAQGLNVLNKHVTVQQNLNAIRTLKALGVECDMGFMLFDPESTIESVRANIAFLRAVDRLVGLPISFVKMLPLAGTTIEESLAAEGRLTGDCVRPDYDLRDRRLDLYAVFVALQFSHRNSDPRGLVGLLRQAYFDALIARRLERAPWANEYRQRVAALAARANASVLDALEQSLELVASCRDGEAVALSWPALTRIADRESRTRAQITADLHALVDRYDPLLGATATPAIP